LACADSSDCPGVDVCCSEQCVEPCLDENLPDGWTCSSECDSGWSGFGDPVPNIQPPGGGGGGGAGQICQVSVARNNCQVIAWLPDVVNPQFCVPHVIGRDPDPSCGSAWCDFGDGIPNCGYPVETSVNIDTCNLGADSNDPCGGAAGSCLEGEVCKLKKGFIGHVCVKDPRRNCAWCGAEPWTSYDQNDAEVNTPASERVTCCYSQDRGVVTSGIPQPPLINEYSYRPCRAEGEPCRKTEDSFTWGECQWARARGAAGCKYMECGPANNINPNPLAVQRLCPGNQPTMDDNININQSSTVIGSEEEEMPVEIYKIDPAAEGLEEGDTIHIKAECDSPLGAGMTGDSVLGFHRNWWNKARGFLGAMLPWVNAQSLCSVGLDVFVASENDLENTLGTSPPHIRSRGAGSDTLDYTVEAEAMAGDAVIVVLAYPASPDIYSLMQTGGGEFDLSGSIAAYVDRTDCEPPPSEAPSNAICNLDGITSLNVSINDVLDGYSSVEKCSNNMSYETTCNLFNVSSVAVNLVSQTEDYMTFESAPFTVPCGSLTPGDDSYYIKVTATEYAYPGGNQCLFDTYIFGRMFNNGNVEIMGTVYNVPEGSEPTYLPLVVGDDELGWAGDSSNNCQFFHTTDYKNAVLTLDR
ncbi:MAG: hypothetical protein U1C49_01370, partial [Candidatus Andersenbacteria bacterium]|nr:hypothetical protein [Candidatus Andersenbacteria bacterium]